MMFIDVHGGMVLWQYLWHCTYFYLQRIVTLKFEVGLHHVLLETARTRNEHH